MDIPTILQYCDQIDALTQAIRTEVQEPPDPPITTIGQGDDLQAALNQGGAIALEASATFDKDSAFQVAQSHTALRGTTDNVIRTSSGHVLNIPINIDDVQFERFAFDAPANEAVQIGVNGPTQNTVDLAPTGVVFRNLVSRGHRGKRAFDVNGAGVEFHDCEVHDCWSPAGVDSQAIAILNAPGPILVNGGYFEAGSENFMVGGDTMKIPNCHPTGITIRNARFSKPLAWKVAGTPKVKNLLELKDGVDVLIDNCDFENSWASGQDGYCFMFTPSVGGVNRNVVVRNCRVSNVGGIVNIIGSDKSGLNSLRTQVSFLGGTYTTNKAQMGGRGVFALVGNGKAPTGPQGCEWLIVEACTISVDGTAFIDVYDTVPGSVDLLRIVGCRWNYPTYGIRFGGYSHGEDRLGVVKQIVIEGNTISNAASAFKTRYPNNTYVTA